MPLSSAPPPVAGRVMSELSLRQAASRPGTLLRLLQRLRYVRLYRHYRSILRHPADEHLCLRLAEGRRAIASLATEPFEAAPHAPDIGSLCLAGRTFLP